MIYLFSLKPPAEDLHGKNLDLRNKCIKYWQIKCQKVFKCLKWILTEWTHRVRVRCEKQQEKRNRSRHCPDKHVSRLFSSKVQKSFFFSVQLHKNNRFSLPRNWKQTLISSNRHFFYLERRNGTHLKYYRWRHRSIISRICQCSHTHTHSVFCTTRLIKQLLPSIFACGNTETEHYDFQPRVQSVKQYLV